MVVRHAKKTPAQIRPGVFLTGYVSPPDAEETLLRTTGRGGEQSPSANNREWHSHRTARTQLRQDLLTRRIQDQSCGTPIQRKSSSRKAAHACRSPVGEAVLGTPFAILVLPDCLHRVLERVVAPAEGLVLAHLLLPMPASK